MYSLGLGVTGAAISTVISQYVFVKWILLFHILYLDFANSHLFMFNSYYYFISDTLSPF